MGLLVWLARVQPGEVLASQSGSSNMLTLWASDPDSEIITGSKPPCIVPQGTLPGCPTAKVIGILPVGGDVLHAFVLGPPLVMALR